MIVERLTAQLEALLARLATERDTRYVSRKDRAEAVARLAWRVTCDEM